MALNIKNEEVEKLVEEVSRATGETKTEAVRKALLERKRRLAYRLGSRDRWEEVHRFLQREIWSRVPEEQLGEAPTKEETEEILGIGPEGF
ncbi:MAG: type II toxin-antitoxin system VapB family antitoxin [Gemmatimonadota bacterium]|nr:type II toxin-antitoxin system VapB family antitoxin [Gemmatimonadota bacterium]